MSSMPLYLLSFSFQTGMCGNDVELIVSQSQFDSVCSCQQNSNLILRPCLVNANWGGYDIGCDAQSQTITLGCIPTGTRTKRKKSKGKYEIQQRYVFFRYECLMQRRANTFLIHNQNINHFMHIFTNKFILCFHCSLWYKIFLFHKCFLQSIKRLH